MATSRDGTVITKITDSPIVTASGEQWTLRTSQNGQLACNNYADAGTSYVWAAGYKGGKIVWQSRQGLWFSKTLSKDAWVKLSGAPAGLTFPALPGVPPPAPTRAEVLADIDVLLGNVAQVNAALTKLRGEI